MGITDIAFMVKGSEPVGVDDVLSPSFHREQGELDHRYSDASSMPPFIHPVWSFQPHHYLVLSVNAIAGIGFREKFLQDGCRTKIVALYAGVGAGSNVFYTSQLAYTIKMNPIIPFGSIVKCLAAAVALSCD
jgi:hypothetical protein